MNLFLGKLWRKLPVKGLVVLMLDMLLFFSTTGWLPELINERNGAAIKVFYLIWEDCVFSVWFDKDDSLGTDGKGRFDNPGLICGNYFVV